MLVMGTSLLNWKPRELEAKLDEVENSQTEYDVWNGTQRITVGLPFIIKGLIAKKI